MLTNLRARHWGALMRRIVPASIVLASLCAMSVAQQAAKPAAGIMKPVRPANQLETAQLRLALQKSAANRQAFDAARLRLKLPPLDAAVIARTKVPVLAVMRGTQFANIRIRSSVDHVVVAGGDETRGFVLTGTRLARTVAKPQAFRALKPADDQLLKSVLAARSITDPISDVDVTRTEDGYDISFRRYGALYDLRMACADTEAAACSKEEALKLLADTQVLGGGE